jgi:acetyltransferase
MLYELASILLVVLSSLCGCIALMSTGHVNGDFSADLLRERYTAGRVLRYDVCVVFRPIECSDQAAFKEFFKSLSPASVHFRFLAIIKELPNEEVERYCNLDFSKEMAIVAVDEGCGEIVGAVRLVVDRRLGQGEFALEVADAWHGMGLGWQLTDYIIKIAKDYGLKEIHCIISSDNHKMIELARKAGMTAKSADDQTTVMTFML